MIYILIPVYNAEETIIPCLDSIVHQTVEEWEAVVVNDGSTDDTLNILLSYNDTRISVLSLNRHSGISNALNAGLEYIRSLNSSPLRSFDMVVRMDADDIMFPDRLQRQREHLDLNPRAEVSCGALKYSIGGEVGYEEAIGTKEVMERIPFFNPIAHPTVAFRGDLANVVQYNPLCDGVEDYLLWVEMLRKGVMIKSLGGSPLITYNNDKTTSSEAESHHKDAAKKYTMVAKGIFSLYGVKKGSEAEWASTIYGGTLRSPDVWYSFQEMMDNSIGMGVNPEALLSYFSNRYLYARKQLLSSTT